MKKRIALVLATLLLAGCTATKQPPAPAPDIPAPVDQPVAQPVEKGPKAEELLPAEGWKYPYWLSDGNGSLTDEQYVRDGERLIGAANGKTYVTWFVTKTGIWRPDPKGPGLLRYLPPTLKDNLTWTQTSGSDEVWFRLRERHECEQNNGKEFTTCWELTVLNRLERTVFRFNPGSWIFRVWSENMANPKDFYRKELTQAGPTDKTPPREQMLREGAKLPTEFPSVSEVKPAEFEGALQAALVKAKRPYLEIDLDADGQKERIEGNLGEWTEQPIRIFKGGASLSMWETGGDRSHRLEIVSLPGFDRPTLLHENGNRDTWHGISTNWVYGNQLMGAWGWHPKITEAFGANVQVEKDGTITITNNPADMVGYTWTRRYRIEKEQDQFHAKLQGESFKAGSYPTKEADVLTAAFIAAWYGLDEDLARYMPDPNVRNAFQGSKQIVRPGYTPDQAKIGKVVKVTKGQPPQVFPELQPAPIGPDGVTEFLIGNQQYEGGSWSIGSVTFGKEADGRTVIRRIEFKETGWSY